MVDATTATVKANSPQVVAVFLKWGGPFGWFFPEVGDGVVNAGTAVYQVSTAGKPGGPFDPIIYIPTGTQPGTSNDHHLVIVDNVRGRWHDFEMYGDPLPTKYFTNGQVVGWTGGSSMAAGATQEPDSTIAHSGATAAGFPLRQGLVTVADVKAGVINHPLVFSANNLGPAPNPYPSNATAGYTSPLNPAVPLSDWKLMPPLGTWMRLSPTANLGGLSGFDLMVAKALQRYGMFCRDRGSNFALHGLDDGGGGRSFPAWRAAGVALGSSGAVRLSASFPWASLQVLNPPPTVW